MLRRILASVFLLTLLVAQAASAACRLRCDHLAAAAPCHTMAMPGVAPTPEITLRATTPCTAHPCIPHDLLLDLRKPSRPTTLASSNTHPLALHLQPVSGALGPPRSALSSRILHHDPSPPIAARHRLTDSLRL